MFSCLSALSHDSLWLPRSLSQIELIDRVDDIYRNTSWDDEYKGYGVQIQQVSEWVGLQVEVRDR